MGLIMDLFVVASMPVAKVLLISAIGLFLALDRVNILGESARNHLNILVFYVFNPALVGGNLARTVTFERFLSLLSTCLQLVSNYQFSVCPWNIFPSLELLLWFSFITFRWFMPVNILITFIIGSALGWILVKVTRAPKHLKGLIIGACSAGNMGNLPIILVPAMCKERGSPFGDPLVCEESGLAYASLSLAVGAVYVWLYVYNIVRVSVEEAASPNMLPCTESVKEPLLSSDHGSVTASNGQLQSSSSRSSISFSVRVNKFFSTLSEKINFKAVFAPSTIGAIIGFAVGMIPALRQLLVGHAAPLHVLSDSSYMLGDATIPAITLIIGANLLKGFKGSGIQLRIVMGIVAVRYIILPLLGILIVKAAVDVGFVPAHDKLFVFVLLLQYSLPPAMNIGTITQLFGAGQSECSVIMLWTYALASVSLSLWSTLFLWLVAT